MSHPAAPSIRLTRRGRALVVCALAALGLGALGMVNTAIAADQPRTTTVVVQPGESLWTIATMIDPGRDPRATIHEIKSLNQLGNAVVQVGQTLLVPSA